MIAASYVGNSTIDTQEKNRRAQGLVRCRYG